MADLCSDWDAGATIDAVNDHHHSINTPGAATTAAASSLLGNAMESAGSLVGCGEDVDCLGSALQWSGLSAGGSRGGGDSDSNDGSWSFSSLISPVWDGVTWLAGKQPEE